MHYSSTAKGPILRTRDEPHSLDIRIAIASMPWQHSSFSFSFHLLIVLFTLISTSMFTTAAKVTTDIAAAGLSSNPCSPAASTSVFSHSPQLMLRPHNLLYSSNDAVKESFTVYSNAERNDVSRERNLFKHVQHTSHAITLRPLVSAAGPRALRYHSPKRKLKATRKVSKVPYSRNLLSRGPVVVISWK